MLVEVVVDVVTDKAATWKMALATSVPVEPLRVSWYGPGSAVFSTVKLLN